METNEYNRKEAAEAILEMDDSRLGDTFRADREGLSLQEQAQQAGTERWNFVYNHRHAIRALVEGVIPDGPTLALQAARRTRTLLKRTDLPPELRAEWVLLEQQLTARAGDKGALEAEVEENVKVTIEAESKGIPGIYVYTLPHYLRHPVDDETGKTLLKVGHSTRDAVYRASSQGRFTALPEDPILLRIYPVDQSAEMESKFHEWLRMADHRSPRTRRAGTEWFVTSTKFLDHVASHLGLDVEVVSGIEVGDE